MAEWEKTILPDEHHAALEAFVGSWTRSYRILQNPAANTEVQVTRKMTMGGRFLWEEETGEMVGREILGYGVHGFNRATGMYERVEWSNVDTGIRKWTGSLDEATGEYTYRGKFRDQILDRWIETKLVLRFASPDRLETVLYEASSTEDGTEPEAWRKTMEITDVREPSGS